MLVEISHRASEKVDLRKSREFLDIWLNLAVSGCPVGLVGISLRSRSYSSSQKSENRENGRDMTISVFGFRSIFNEGSAQGFLKLV